MYSNSCEECGSNYYVGWEEPIGRYLCPSCAPSQKTTALSTQVGGGHYKKYEIQPVTFCQVNKLGYCESNVVKYICRWKEKGGLEDLKKVKHYVDLLIEIEGLDES